MLFTDESKFNLHGSDGKVMVWRKPNTELDSANLQPTVKHGGGSVMVWGCMSASGVGELVFIEGMMTKEVYLDILRENLHRSAEKLGIRGTFKFYQDNDPKHKAHVVREWLLYNCPKVLETPPQSPDLNPIEHIWDELQRKVKRVQVTSRADLKRALRAAWDDISPHSTNKLVASMPNRLQEVIKRRGFPTKY